MKGPRPEISLVNIVFQDASFFETNGVFTVRIDNQRPTPLHINGGSYQLEINGVKIGRGTSDERLEIPRFGSATQNVKVHLSNLSMLSNLRPLIELKDFEYRIKGSIYTDGVFGFAGTDVEVHQRFEMPQDSGKKYPRHNY